MYSVVKDEKSITLVPLSLKHVHKDQLKFKRESKVDGSENTDLIMSHKRKEKNQIHPRGKKLVIWLRVERRINERRKK